VKDDSGRHTGEKDGGGRDGEKDDSGSHSDEHHVKDGEKDDSRRNRDGVSLQRRPGGGAVEGEELVRTRLLSNLLYVGLGEKAQLMVEMEWEFLEKLRRYSASLVRPSTRTEEWALRVWRESQDRIRRQRDSASGV